MPSDTTNKADVSVTTKSETTSFASGSSYTGISRNLLVTNLHGRDDQKQVLCKALRDAEQTKQVVFLHGAAGSGKSALMSWLALEANAESRIFASGSYSHTDHNGPYFAFRQICRQLCSKIGIMNTQTSSDAAESISTHNENARIHQDIIEKIRAKVGTTGIELLSRLLPELKAPEDEESGEAQSDDGLAKQPHLEERIQLHLAFRAFFQVVSNIRRLVLVIDDIHWAHRASIELLEYIIKDTNNTRMMIVACYRDSEVGPDHLLAIMMRDVKESAGNQLKQQLNVIDIEVGNLEIDSIHGMLLDSLGEAKDEAGNELMPLAQVVHEKTGGNALFAAQLIHSLIDEHLVSVDRVPNKPRYDIDQIKLETMATSNVVELMETKLHRIPRNILCLTQLATCLGTTISADLLEIVIADLAENPGSYNMSGAVQSKDCSADSLIRSLCKEGLIFKVKKQADRQTQYCWVHDKIREAAAIKGNLVPKIHGHIGWLLLDKLSEEDLGHHLFTVVSLLNTGSTLIRSTESAKRVVLAQLNLRAGKRQMKATGFTTAAASFNKGLKLLPPNHWRIYTELSLDMHSSAAEAEYCLGNLEAMEKLCRDVISRPLQFEQKRRAYFILTEGVSLQGRCDEAITYCSGMANELDNPFPSRFLTARVIAGVMKLKQMANQGLAEQTSKLPAMTNPKKLLLLSVLDDMTKYAYLDNKPMLLSMNILIAFQITMEHGKAENFAHILQQCGFLLTISGMAKEGRIFVDQSLLESEKANSARYTGLSYGGIFILSYHWTGDARYCAQQLVRGHDAALTAGIVEGACWCSSHMVQHNLILGTPLGQLWSIADECQTEFQEFHQDRMLDYNSVVRQVVANLMGSVHDSRLIGEYCNAESKLAAYQESNNLADMGVFQCFRIYLAFLFDDYAEVFKAREAMSEEEAEKASPMVSCLKVANFSVALAAASMYRKTKKRKYKALCTKVYKRIKGWVARGDPNSIHYRLIIKAELLDINNSKTADVEELFAQALAHAKEREQLNDCGIGCQRLAEFYARRGNVAAAHEAAEKCIGWFTKWGATRKVQNLQKNFPCQAASVTLQPEHSVPMSEISVVLSANQVV